MLLVRTGIVLGILANSLLLGSQANALILRLDTDRGGGAGFCSDPLPPAQTRIFFDGPFQYADVDCDHRFVALWSAQGIATINIGSWEGYQRMDLFIVESFDVSERGRASLNFSAISGIDGTGGPASVGFSYLLRSTTSDPISEGGFLFLDATTRQEQFSFWNPPALDFNVTPGRYDLIMQISGDARTNDDPRAQLVRGRTTVNYQWSFTAAPEQGTWMLLILGFGGTGLAMRRKQRMTGSTAGSA